jgi:AraC-like DNA-binding protein
MSGSPPSTFDPGSGAPGLAGTSPWLRTREPLIWLRGLGHEFRDATYGYDARLRVEQPNVVIQLTLAGTGYYESRRGERMLLGTGSAFIDLIPGPFRYGHAAEVEKQSDVQRTYELVYVSTHGPVAMRWARRIIRAFGNVLHFGQATPAPLMLDLVRRHERDALGDRYQMSGLLYQLYMSIFSTLSASRVATEPRVGRALAIISRRATDASFAITSIATELDCSREYLTRRFRAATGVSPSDYLVQQRLRLAAMALRTGDDKLEAIARRCGFSNANYFCRVFRKHVGVTPAAFRARPWMTVA